MVSIIIPHSIPDRVLARQGGKERWLKGDSRLISPSFGKLHLVIRSTRLILQAEPPNIQALSHRSRPCNIDYQ
jgi:hypothetical protein